jgi:nitrate reductase assembly molybdenum cofactor insertion protein NarJ
MTEAKALELLREAAEWRLIGLLLACPQGDWQTQVAALAAEVHDKQLTAAAAAARQEAGEGLYHTTFGPGGPAAPREISHREYLVPGPSLSELSACYDAFAYRPATDEPPDHVAVEADFIAYLRLKEAYAVARDDDEQTAVTAEAARRFVEDHLSSIAEPLALSLAASGISYLRLAAAALLRRVGPPRHVVPAAGPLPAFLDETCLSGCASAEELES